MTTPSPLTSRLLASFIALLLTFSLGSGARAAVVFYTFDTAMNGNGSFTTDVAGNDGFAQVSSVTQAGSNILTNTGGASYVDPDGNTWAGSGSSVTPGHSLTWTGLSSGNSFSLTLDTTGLANLNVTLDIRSAGTTPVTMFSSLIYSVNGGPGISINVPLSFSTGSFNEWTADLSSITALNNQPNVTLTWNLPNIAGGNSLRIDNLEISAAAIPEPSTVALALSGLLYFVARRGQLRRFMA